MVLSAEGSPAYQIFAEEVSMNSLACRAQTAPDVINRAIGPTDSLVIGPGLQFTKSSGYDRAEEEQLKAEQSATTDLPLHALTVEMKEGILAASAATIKSPFGQAPASYFKRTAHALATLAPQSKVEQAATMGCLPAFASKISFCCKKSPVIEIGSPPRRRLLPQSPTKTAFIPAGDPIELRQLVQEMQQKRSHTIDQARITARLQTLNAAGAQMPSPGHSAQRTNFKSLVNTRVRRPLKRLVVLLGDLIDKLAVA
jgi:hypothetical protein